MQASKVIDQFRDPVMAVLVGVVSDRPKLAAAARDIDVDASEADSLPDTAFAWPEKRAFPIHTSGHALLSRAYREAAGKLPDHVDRTLKEACDVYGIDEALFAREAVKVAEASDDDFLLPGLRRLKVTEQGHVKEAEEKLHAGRARLTFEHRAEAAVRLVEKAASYGVPLGVETYKMAGMVATDTRVMADWIGARAAAAPPEHRDGFQKLAEAAMRLPKQLWDRDTQVKLADALGELDRAAGLEKHYDRKLPDPLATVFNTDKIAGQGVDLAGTFMPLERIASHPSTFYADVLGEDVVREASDAAGGFDPVKMAEVLATLPRDMQRLLASHMR